MARLVCALLLVAAVTAASASAPGLRAWMRPGGGDDPPASSCLSHTDEEGCLADSSCSWCSNAVLGKMGCLSNTLAKLVPTSLAECKAAEPQPSSVDELAKGNKKHHDKPKPKPPTSCADNKDKHDCVKLGAQEGQCAWCAGDYMPASCLTAMAAKYLPVSVAKCKLPKEREQEALREDPSGGGDDPKPKPKPPTSCGDNDNKHDCLKLGAQEGQCAWCAGDYMPASCVGIKAAEWIPEQVAKCKLPRKQEQLAAPVARKHKKHDDDSGSGSGGKWPSGGGDWPSGGGDWPSGGGDWPSGGGGKSGCMALTSKKKCLKGTDTEACAWCGSASFLGSPCVSEATAKYLPKSVADCKMGDGKKKHREAAVAVA